MQIFDDKKKRIGLLTGFKDRSITTTLDTGDKELSFEYPANGKLVDLLKEEHYIRTKTDEFVLKAVETGERFNKYTAVLNVEELEGTPFPYGFESQEQTIRACLTFAFEGTGWTVRTCTVTKKRTINEEESVTAWDVLQKCVTTYRCECVIDSLNKAIDIYERIGSDKGCYFVEGLNLRKLSLKSDTYEFYTRIYPIGKDGITPEWMLGHDYIDNFQYSSKVKSFTWKDERYTNTTSLIEDATAKLEEVSRPYKAFTVEVTDLAKASEKHKEILSYGIGDIITLVSKKTRTKEKQRIVKITVFPEERKKNTVEISNARKTFAQIQQEATAAAKEEAIAISNRTTKKVLGDYSTTEEIETKITASKEEIELGVMSTLEGYYDKTETKSQIEISKGEIELETSKKYQTKDEMGNYSTTEETKAFIDLTVDGIETGVKKILEEYDKTEISEAKIKVVADEIASEVKRATEEEGELSGKITQNANSITSEVKRAGDAEGKLSSRITQNANSITAKVSKGEVSSQISMEGGEIDIEGNRIAITSSNFSLTKEGNIIGKNVNLSGKMETTDGNLKTEVKGGQIDLSYKGENCGSIHPSAYNSDAAKTLIDIRAKTYGLVFTNKDTKIHYIMDCEKIIDGSVAGVNYRLLPNKWIYGGNVFKGAVMIESSLYVGGSKNRIVETKDYGTAYLSAVESAACVFQDYGSGTISESGMIEIFPDEMFMETVNMDMEYFIQTQQTSEGGIDYVKKEKDYFTVYGTAGTTFDWVLTAKQKGYETSRLENFELKEDISEPNMFDDSVFVKDAEPINILGDYMDEYERSILTI